MLSFDNTVNLLMQSKYRYQLQDVAEPNLYREIYDYSHVPKVAFNLRHVPMQMPDEIWMTDTTFRDGQQSVSPFTPEQILHLFKLMSRLGGPNGMVRQSEFFLYTENDQKALHLCQDAGLRFPEITTWIRANEKDFELVKHAGVAETGVLVSCSDYHIFNKMHLTRSQAMDKYLGIVKSALDHGIRPRCHFEDITRADFYGFVVPASRSRSAPAIPWVTASAIPAPPCPAASRASSTACAIMRRCPPASWSGTVTTTFTRSFPTPPPLGSTAARASTAASWASVSALATARWKPWPSSIRACAAIPAAWT